MDKDSGDVARSKSSKDQSSSIFLANAKQVARVPYTATYYFYRAAAGA